MFLLPWKRCEGKKVNFRLLNENKEPFEHDVKPISEDPPLLTNLLAEVTEETLHAEWETGPAVGNEIW